MPALKLLTRRRSKTPRSGFTILWEERWAGLFCPILNLWSGWSKAGVENPKPPGRKKGHAPAHRPVPDHLDEEVTVPLHSCPSCAGVVEDVRDLSPIVVVDVGAAPNPGGARVRRRHCQSGYGRNCRRRVQSRHPDQPWTARGAQAVHIAPRMQALAADLHSRVGVTYRKITGIFKLFFGVTFSAGAWSRAARRITKRLEPTYRSLVAAARTSAVTHLDQTGWYVAMVRGTGR